MAEPAPSPGQTIGPFFGFAMSYQRDCELVPPGHPGAIELSGYVYDGAGVGLPDALIEIRQTDEQGLVPRLEGSLARSGLGFTGWGRCATDRTGRYWFRTVRPAPTSPEAPAFFAVTLFARGLLDRLFTRIYLPDTVPPETPATPGAHPSATGLGPEERARMTATAGPSGSLRFDFHLQGPDESVFLSFPRHRDE